MNLTPSQAPRGAWSDAELKRLWTRMGDVFGVRWYEQNGPEPTESWKNGLRQHQREHVIAAVVGYETEAHNPFSPNLPQFLEEVRAARRRMRPEPPSLPAPQRSPEQIERMRAGLKRARDYAAAAAARIMAHVKHEPPPGANDDFFERRK